MFLDFDCVVRDAAEVRIGAGTRLGPAIRIHAADHPRDAAGRAGRLELGRPVRIGRGVWIGGGAAVLPGVTIGDGTVVGNPARPCARHADVAGN